MPWGIHGDQAVDGATQKKLRILVDQIRLVTMAGDEVEISFLQKMVFDSAHDHGGVTFAHFRDNYADDETAAGSQGPGKKVGAVVEFARGGENAVFRFLRNRFRHR